MGIYQRHTPARSASSSIRNDFAEEEEGPIVAGVFLDPGPAKRRKQSDINKFLVKKHSLQNDMVRLATVSNISMNVIVTDETMRRVLTRAYPGDPEPPKSIAPLRNLLSEKATNVRDELQATILNIRKRGWST